MTGASPARGRHAVPTRSTWSARLCRNARSAPLLAGAMVLAVAVGVGTAGALARQEPRAAVLPSATSGPVPAPSPSRARVTPSRAATPSPAPPAPSVPPSPSADPVASAVPEPSVVPPVAPASAPSPVEPAPGGPVLAWAPPELDSPETVQVTQGDRDLRLDPERDYVLVMPPEPLVGGLSVNGGDDVVMVGGEITVPAGSDGNRGLALKRQRGTVHVEGLAITGDGLGEGINLDQTVPGAVVQLQNVRVSTVSGSKDGHHADVLQTWAGPAELRIDRLSASTTYQGFFLLPRQFGDQPEPGLFDLRRVDITGVGEHGYLLWRDDLSWPLRAEEVRLRPSDPGRGWEQVMWPRADGDRERLWDGVTVETGPVAPFVADGVAGTGYTSPGYARG